MKAIMEKWSYNSDRGWECKITKEFIGDSESNLFEKIDKENNRFRYCMSEWRFTDINLKNRFNKWLKGIDYSKGMDLFYGNSVVD